MKKKLLFFLMLLPLVASANPVNIDGIYYNCYITKNGNYAEVKSNPYEYAGNIVIPKSVTYGNTEFSVTSIVGYAFYNCSSLTSVNIPNSVTSIGSSAFSGCSGLTAVNIPNSVISIGERAFSYCSSLTSVTIPNSVTAIGDWTFYGCSSLTSVNIPNSVTSIGSYAFYGCSSLTAVTIPNSVKSIYECAFSGCSGLTSITIPNSVTSMSWDVFHGCSGLTSVTIPNSLTSISSGNFSGCSSLTAVNIPNSVTLIGSNAFYGCSALTSVNIPNSVTSIGDNAFSSCSGLTAVNVESGNLKYDSRENCNAIIETETNTLISGCQKTIIPNSVTTIGRDAFYRCSGLTSITIPNSVTYISSYAFAHCKILATVISQIAKPFNIDNNVFEGIANGAILYVPAGKKASYLSKIYWNSFTNIKELKNESLTLSKNVVTFTSALPLDFSTPISGLKAYTVSEVTDGRAVLTEVTTAVPAGTGLILKGTAGETYEIPYTLGNVNNVTNKLVGVLTDFYIGGNDLDYILKDGKFVKASAGMLSAGKAYLKLDAALARGVVEIDGDATGVGAALTNSEERIVNSEVYNLQGQRISKPAKGLYVVDGKKVFVK